MYEYKYVLLDAHSGQALSWQRGNNSVLALRAGEDRVEVRLLRQPVLSCLVIFLLILLSWGGPREVGCCFGSLRPVQNWTLCCS